MPLEVEFGGSEAQREPDELRQMENRQIDFRALSLRCADLLPAGGTCVINSGRYREKVTPLNSGTTYQAAAGATVTVDGTDYVNGWSPVTSGDLTTLEQTDPYLSTSPFAGQITPTSTTSPQRCFIVPSGIVPCYSLRARNWAGRAATIARQAAASTAAGDAAAST